MRAKPRHRSGGVEGEERGGGVEVGDRRVVEELLAVG